MKTSDFYFDLPEELIAQVPILDRSSSKLMVLDKIASRIEIIISEGRFEIVERIFETISYSNNSNAIIYIDVNNNFSST